MSDRPDRRPDDCARPLSAIRAAARAGALWTALACPAVADAGGPPPAQTPSALAPAIAAERDALIARRCAGESLAAGRAACISLLADETLLAVDTRLTRLTADPSAAGASARALAAFDRALTRAQRDWRRGMEAGCKSASEQGGARIAPQGADRSSDRRTARQTCRLGQALARQALVAETIATAFARAGLAAPGPDPLACAIFLRLLPGTGEATGARTRARPLLDCDLADLIPPAPGIDLR